MLTDASHFAQYLSLGIELEILQIDSRTGNLVSSCSIKEVSDLNTISINFLMNSVGFGIDLKKNHLVSIEFEQTQNPITERSYGEKMVDYLGIDETYPWIVCSGSHLGIQILMDLADFDSEKPSLKEKEEFFEKRKKEHREKVHEWREWHRSRILNDPQLLEEKFKNEKLTEKDVQDKDRRERNLLKAHEEMLYGPLFFNNNINKKFRRGEYGSISIIREGIFILPPSLHHSGGRYEFITKSKSISRPNSISNLSLTRFMVRFCLNSLVPDLNAEQLWSCKPFVELGYARHDCYSTTKMAQHFFSDHSRPSLIRKTIVIDTETTGIPSFNFQPDLIQISWMVLFEYRQWVICEDEEESFWSTGFFHLVKTRSYNIYNPEVSLSDKIEKITGLNDEILRVTNCREIALKELNEDLKMADRIVGHNIEFDIPFLRDFINSSTDTKIGWRFDNMDVYCTMKTPWKELHKKPKFIKLSILAKSLQIPFDEKRLHNSLYDVSVTMKAYRELAHNPTSNPVQAYLKNY